MTAQTIPGDSISLSSGTSRAEIALLGAQPIRWQVGGRDLLWSGDPAYWAWHAPVLFPVVGQVKGARVRIAGRSYDMPRHGFARTSRFRCVERGPDQARLRLEPEDADTTFPLPFRLDLEVRLELSALRLAFTVHNPGPDVLPYALGLHPAFPWPFDGSSPEGHRLVFAEPERPEVPVITAEGLIATARRPIPLADRKLALASDLFRDDALVFLDAHSRSWRFEAPSGAAIEMTVEHFPHLAAWTKPGAPFLSLEAWTGYADPEGFDGDLQDKPAMICLEPGAQRCHRLAMIVHDSPSSRTRDGTGKP
ncbi:aldose 1-epimerase family protein [Microvirga pudoricolor]|uniref:aldose 1-epimerase family protein n=1 Tax=Microvirga pudoricolor TaxID=2778729 RepID=UPI00194FFE45|nr:aldose 1-epimerase family protein [Microvirga pudoricolor]MBM6593670.1 aldose 1-epimerase family protein [Microvirga pudoricolor]